ncbi:nicotinate-nucleotide adenylyltransferase [Legionella cardiaca]|uniref:Probable nicotinate-nucleotide adenylyltransferase n=1 Tax=Legionella cardiaca TaxID=1071983 RepID=A0ABY8AUQ3_9GAMM|nr:nicotinate-nucleotide adenylyltransferase [Legionella cardiaca]WED44159.1 nicotinate-nucleotide adenylyltransferase [Legionella cardiaca]
MRNLIIYGGTFDPIHNGHINTAINVQKKFNFDQFIFLPCKLPVLKAQAAASASQRVIMLELALKELDKKFVINLSEVNRNSPSYMVETLKQFRNELGQAISITLLIGVDAFMQLPKWYAWEQLLTLTNLLVINRAGIDTTNFPEAVIKLLSSHQTHEANAILNHSHGLIYCFNAGNFDISSTAIRKKIATGEAVSADIPESVLKFIKSNNLYTTD